MKKAKGAAIALLVGCALLLGAAAEGGAVTNTWALKNLNNRLKGHVQPGWQIFQPETAKSVAWAANAANPRFAVFDAGTSMDVTDDLVLDKETGLVWERQPSGGQRNWSDYVDWCYSQSRFGRKGFRLPSMDELATLLDMSSVTVPILPAGHPFLGVQSASYWSVDTASGSDARTVSFTDGDPGIWAKSTATIYGWCVRGPGGK